MGYYTLYLQVVELKFVTQLLKKYSLWRYINLLLLSYPNAAKKAALDQILMAAAATTTSAALFYRVKNCVVVWLLGHFRDDLLVDDDAIFDDKDCSCK